MMDKPTPKRPAKGRTRPTLKPRPAPTKTPRRTARLRAVLKLFGAPELARICKVTRQGVAQWRDLPAKHALQVEKASKGKFTKEFLAPNFYPATAR